mgnify:CR=1 FL=1
MSPEEYCHEKVSKSGSNFVGAYFAAQNGLRDIPVNWIKKTIPARNILKHIS